MTPPETARPHAAIVYNPVKVELERVREVVEAAERDHGWGRSRWYETSDADSGRGAGERALLTAPTVVVVAGGDGTVRAVGEVLQGTHVPLALLPAGTGNLLARNLGIPLDDVEGAIGAAFGGATRLIDVAVADLEAADGSRSRHAFMVMAGIGLDAEMAANTSALAKRHLGWFAYVGPIARSVARNRQFHLHYRVDRSRARSARAHTIIVGNCGTLTGNMLLIPGAVIDDGLLDVVMLRPKTRFGWAGIGTRLTIQGLAHRSRLGRKMLQLAPDLKALAYAQGRQFEADFTTPHGIELDGDSFGSVVRAAIGVHPGALRVRIPEDGETRELSAPESPTASSPGR